MAGLFPMPNELHGAFGLAIVLQVAPFFALVAVWGWWQWLRGRADDGRALHVQKLAPRGVLLVVVASALFWLATGWFLQTHTDSGVAWWDAFPTGLSIVGQFLLEAVLLSIFG